MNISTRNVILVVVALFFISSCDFTDNSLKMVNESSSDIYYRALPDTTFQIKDVDFLPKVKYRKIGIGDTSSIIFARLNEGRIAKKINAICQDSALNIFIFSIDTVRKYSWSEIKKNHKYTRLNFKVKTLDSLKWTIIYR